MSRSTKILVAAALSAGVVAASSSASFAGSGQFFTGLAAGTIAGAALAGATAAPAYPPAYGPQPVYGPTVYSPRYCWYESRPVVNQMGFVIGSQTVKMCR